MLGYKIFSQIDAFGNKVIRVFLGIQNVLPIAAINGDMDCISCCVRRKTNIIHFWNILMCMNNNHLPKILFNWDYLYRGNA